MGVRQNLREGVVVTRDNLRATKKELIDGADGREILLLFGIIPGILLAVELAILSNYWILASVKRSVFWLEIIGQPLFSLDTLVDSYISSIAHSDWETHLKPNLTNYLLCLTALYPMAILSNRKSEVSKIVLILLFATPLVTTVASFQYPMGARSIGFSGVLSAFFGVLPVVMFAAIDSHIDKNLNPFWSGMVMFAVYASIYVYFGNVILTGVTILFVLLFFIGMVIRIGLDGLMEALQVVFGIGYLPFLWALVIAYAGAVGMYYNLPLGTNIVAHLAGYIFGFIVGFLWLGESFSVDWISYDWA
ncbi:hypothetical protein [Halostagnicola kamekurae]|uniref:Membrane associated serine protease, rhomboid family n=1 Tax=Halostagnicola kamekurae TaxID=619731 RepID=A0A1I6UTD4_9EURY|nr:hypothetical protein [Halostagnicola kamekurae]SFT04752.1 hypothetical protein SAMN04488556_4085 [Halostagnicola kamekurae]